MAIFLLVEKKKIKLDVFDNTAWLLPSCLLGGDRRGCLGPAETERLGVQTEKVEGEGRQSSDAGTQETCPRLAIKDGLRNIKKPKQSWWWSTMGRNANDCFRAT